MLAKRIIPCLDVDDGRTVKGIRFKQLQEMGDPVELGKFYSQNGADELVFLDITATHEKRKTLKELVVKVARNLNIPFTVGGGIQTTEDARELLDSGADKISINSAAIQKPELIDEIATNYGSQFITLAVDAKLIQNQWHVFINGGRKNTGRELFEWCKEGENRGCGEILFTSMDHDGLKNGYALNALKSLHDQVNIPIIASGGAGRARHFTEVFQETGVEAALAAGIFHNKTITINEIKQNLQSNEIPVRI